MSEKDRKRRREPSEYNPRERQKIAQYYRAKKGRGQTRSNSTEPRPGTSRERDPEEYSDNEWSGDDEGMVEHDQGAPGGDMEDGTGRGVPRGMAGGGGGATGVGLGVQEAGDRPFGSKVKVYSKTFTKSYTVYITNGVNDLAWTQTAGTTQASPKFNWNEGWSVLGGYGKLSACMTPNDWYKLQVNASRWRIKSAHVLLEGLIPFQETLDPQGNPVTVATASNRPNVWYYIDDGKTLPKLPTTTLVQHNDFFQTPYGGFTNCVLPRPSFVFENVDVNNMPYKVAPTLPPTNRPQGIFSLLSSGKVKTLNPGQKIEHTWHNPKKQWQMVRLNNDLQDNYTANAAASAAAWQASKAQALTTDWRAGVSSRCGTNSLIGPSSVLFNQYEPMDHYADTGFHVGECGPPYVMCKVEPYFDTQDNVANIYMQAHLHYSVTVEWLESENHNTVAWFNPVSATATTGDTDFAARMTEFTASAGEGNEQQLIYGPGNTSHMFT